MQSVFIAIFFLSLHSPERVHATPINGGTVRQQKQLSVDADGSVHDIPHNDDRDSTAVLRVASSGSDGGIEAEKASSRSEEPSIRNHPVHEKATSNPVLPWWFRYVPTALLMSAASVISIYKLSRAQKNTDQAGQIEEAVTAYWWICPVLTALLIIAGVTLVLLHVLSPGTALAGVTLAGILVKQLHHTVIGAEDEADIEYDAGRLALLDNIKFVGMCGVIAHHLITTFFVGTGTNPYLRATPIDRFLGWLRFWCLPLFILCAGMMRKDRFSLSSALQLLTTFLVLNFWWYAVGHSGTKEEPALHRPFVYSENGKFFNPFLNYSLGGYLWFIQFLIVVPPLCGAIRKLAGESVWKTVALGHLSWSVLGLASWHLANTGAFDQRPANEFFFIYSFMFPGLLLYVMATLISVDDIMALREHPASRPLGISILLAYLLFWVLADRELLTWIIHQWDNPLFILFMVWPQSLVLVVSFVVSLPGTETFFTRTGARSLYAYVIHPVVFSLIGTAYQDITGSGLPHASGGGWPVCMAVAAAVVILNLIVGSKVVERSLKPVLS